MDCRPDDGILEETVSVISLSGQALSARGFSDVVDLSAFPMHTSSQVSPPILPRRNSWKIPPADEPIRDIESPCSFPTVGELEGVMYAAGLRNYPWNTTH